MRRTALTLAGLATVGLCTFSLAHSAEASQGVLVLNGTPHANPSGCIESKTPQLTIGNHTNQYAFVFAQPGCAGRPIAAVPPGETGARSGMSVLIS